MTGYKDRVDIGEDIEVVYHSDGSISIGVYDDCVGVMAYATLESSGIEELVAALREKQE